MFPGSMTVKYIRHTCTTTLASSLHFQERIYEWWPFCCRWHSDRTVPVLQPVLQSMVAQNDQYEINTRPRSIDSSRTFIQFRLPHVVITIFDDAILSQMSLVSTPILTIKTDRRSLFFSGAVLQWKRNDKRATELSVLKGHWELITYSRRKLIHPTYFSL